MKVVPISLPDDLRKYADEQSRKHYESLAAYIRRLIAADMRKNAA